MTEENKDITIQKVVILGANGGIGKHIVLSALNAGHKVTAILRTPANLNLEHPNLHIIQGDIMQPEALGQYLKGQDVVISAIGKNSLKKTTLYSQGNKNLIKAMNNVDVKRAFFISASGLEVNPTHSLLVKFATKFILQTLLHNMYADLWRMEKIIKQSNINWTIIRPPKLLDTPQTGNYRIAVNHYLDHAFKISRADIADFIVRNLCNKVIVKTTVEIAY